MVLLFGASGLFSKSSFYGFLFGLILLPFVLPQELKEIKIVAKILVLGLFGFDKGVFDYFRCLYHVIIHIDLSFERPRAFHALETHDEQ